MEKELYLFLKTTSPFYLLPNEELSEVAGLLKKKKYNGNTFIFRQEQSKVEHLSIIFQGTVEKYFEAGDSKGKKFIERLQEGETYGEISILLNNTRSIRTVKTVEPTIIYELPKEKFVSLCNSYESFSDYFTERFGKRILENNYAAYLSHASKKKLKYDNVEDYFTQDIASIYVKKIASCYENFPIRDAARLMTAKRIGCLLIKDRDEDYIGFITDMDLRNKVVAAGYDVNAPVSDIISMPISTISSQAYIYEAILLMFKKKIIYLVVEEKGKFKGIISRNKLLASQARSPFMFIQSVRLATSTNELSAKWKRVPYIVEQLLSRGVKAEIVNQIITTVSDAISHNIIYSTIKKMGKPPANFSFMVLGSEGRKETTLKTDQDNALIYEDVEGEKREEVREYFLKFAEKVSNKLDKAGFTYCTGGFMAKNPKWCHSLSHWKENYKQWIKQTDAESAMKTIIFFDCRNIYGDPKLLEYLKDHVFNVLEGHSSRFMYQLATKALETKPPLSSFLRNFQLISKDDRKNVLDIKKAMRTIVDFARIYALSNSIRVTNTGERLAALLEKDILKREEYKELTQAYYHMMQLRLRKQAESIIIEDSNPDNLIDPKSISKIERVTLKEIFKIIEKYQLKLSIDFTGSLSV